MESMIASRLGTEVSGGYNRKRDGVTAVDERQCSPPGMDTGFGFEATRVPGTQHSHEERL